MSNETTKPPESEAAPSEGEPPKAEEAPKAEWKYKKDFGINNEMKKVIGLTIDAANAEIAALRKKLDKLTYGS